MPGMNRWWEGFPSERYWMEITNRPDLGSDLWAPQLNRSGRREWSYDLVTEVAVGDLVLHWHKTLLGAPALIGWSVASGDPARDEIVWQARGRSARTAPTTGQRAAWTVPLANYTPLPSPVDQDALRREESRLRSVHADLAAAHPGSLYFPFAFSSKRPIRTTQGYLVKYPEAALSIFDELATVPRTQRTVRRRPRAPRPKPGTGWYQSDPLVRAAIERHAVELAMAHFATQGFAVEDVGSVEPYDLVATRGNEVRHVEVKGSTGLAETIELTAGEVRNAETHQPTDLFVVPEINWQREADGSITTSGGEPRMVPDWVPDRDDLTPTSYRYAVPI